tara:strand:+ start:729 stop:1340 length:612 start_codon:yes stop_codon:yes gene_type:complete
MENILKKTLLASVLLGTSITSQAGIISQNHFDGGRVFPSTTYGQSFTAEDSNIYFGFRLVNANPDKGYDERVKYTLLQGDGLGGTELFSVIGTPEKLNGIFMMDFSSFNLEVGKMYTATLQALSNSWRWGAQYNVGGFTGDSYAGGQLYTSGNASKFSDISDMSFRIEPSEVSNSTSVAEPSTLSVLAASLFGFAAFSRRKKK